MRSSIIVFSKTATALGVVTLLASSVTAQQAAPVHSPGEAVHFRTWAHYGGDPQQTRYSSLDQIDRSNVHRLRVAWTFETGDVGPTIQCNPLVVGDVAYVTSPLLKVIALRSDTGAEIWRFDPFGEDYDGPRYWRHVSRGLTYWTDGSDARVFSAAGPFLYALDANSGRRVAQFGDSGRIDLRQGLGRSVDSSWVQATSPGVVYGDLIIVGANVSESPNAAPGDIRAYSVRTGDLVWTFHTIPRPGEFGHDTWEGDSWMTTGGVNPWSGFSLDADRGMVFAATGAPTYDFYGGNRRGRNLFANSVIALEAATGALVWHYQIVRHDIWDYDLPSPPALVHVEREGRRVDAVAQITKTGFVFLLDRNTGEPLFPVEERRVPASSIPGEEAWPTQLFPTKPPPFARQVVTKEDLSDLSPEANAYARELFAGLRAEGLFSPGSREGTLMVPGFLGGGNWSGGAYDPALGRLFVNASNYPSILRLEETPDSLRGRPRYPPYMSPGTLHFVDEEGYPALKPPWGTLTAIDLNAGEIEWQVPLGTYPDLAARGYPPTGTLNLGGAIVTKGGLVFIASTMDRMFRAFDAESGEILWEAELPTAGLALPATYQVRGRQYVVIAAGGGVGMRGARPLETPPGSKYVAFALP